MTSFAVGWDSLEGERRYIGMPRRSDQETQMGREHRAVLRNKQHLTSISMNV